MNSRWETVVALARDVDDDCAAGRKLDLTKSARLARAVLEFQRSLVGSAMSERRSDSMRAAAPIAPDEEPTDATEHAPLSNS
jgi:hypothetical protein